MLAAARARLPALRDMSRTRCSVALETDIYADMDTDNFGSGFICPVRGAARHPSTTSALNHTVKLPRCRKLASYARQFLLVLLARHVVSAVPVTMNSKVSI